MKDFEQGLFNLAKDKRTQVGVGVLAGSLALASIKPVEGQTLVCNPPVQVPGNTKTECRITTPIPNKDNAPVVIINNNFPTPEAIRLSPEQATATAVSVRADTERTRRILDAQVTATAQAQKVSATPIPEDDDYNFVVEGLGSAISTLVVLPFDLISSVHRNLMRSGRWGRVGALALDAGLIFLAARFIIIPAGRWVWNRTVSDYRSWRTPRRAR